MLEVKSAFDSLGRAIEQGFTCPVCGKRMSFMTPTGYCSVQCFAKDLTNRLLTHMKLEQSDPMRRVIGEISDVLDKISLAINLIVELPDILRTLMKVPERWRNYLMVNVNIAFLRLRVVINTLMVKKNEKIIELIGKVRNGVMPDFIKPMFEQVNRVIDKVNLLKQALEAAYTIAMDAMKVYGFQISAESYGWMMTPRSTMNSDAGQVFIELPTHTMDGVANKLIQSGIMNINFQAIDEIVKKVFPPIQSAEYFMEPELFDVRMLFSDQSDIVKQVREKLEMLCVLGLDYMPRYKNLSFLNVWFILALMDGWGQHSRLDFGSLLNPAV